MRYVDAIDTSAVIEEPSHRGGTCVACCALALLAAIAGLAAPAHFYRHTGISDKYDDMSLWAALRCRRDERLVVTIRHGGCEWAQFSTLRASGY